VIDAGARSPNLDVVSMTLGAFPSPLPLSLLQSLGATRSESLLGDTLPWLIALVAIAVLGCVALLVIRRLIQRESTPVDPFTLDDLRAMHRSGQLTDTEFARAKEKMLGGARAMAKRERVRMAEAERARRPAGKGRDAADGRSGERPDERGSRDGDPPVK